MEIKNSSVPNRTRSRYKYCFVSRCTSTTGVLTPGKSFLSIPRKDLKLREKWFAVCRGYNTKRQRRNMADTSANTIFHCCEDHFNEETDYANLMEHRMMGSRLLLKRGVIPSKFDWREHRLRLRKMRMETPPTLKKVGKEQVLSTVGSSGSLAQQRSQIMKKTTPSEAKKVEKEQILSITLNSESLAQQRSQNIQETVPFELIKVGVNQILCSADNSGSLVQQPNQNIQEELKIVGEKPALSTVENSEFLAQERSRDIQKELKIVEEKQQESIAGNSSSLTQRSPSIEKVETFVNSDKMSVSRVQIYPQILPPSFKNIIIEENDEKVIIRSSIQGMSDIKVWINEFEEATYTKWNTRDSNPSLSRLKCKKRFICHRTAHKKVEASKHSRGTSTNLGCKAIISAVVKLTTACTKKKDIYVKDGLPGVITIDVQHNHSLDSTEVLRLLPASDSSKEKFIEYFNAGMGAGKAKEYHESYLMLKKDFTEKDLICGSLNPKMRTIREWYHKWKLEHRKPKTGNVDEIIQRDSKSVSRPEADSAWTKKLLSAMTCETFPEDEDNPQIYAIEIKQEPMNESDNMLSSTTQNVLSSQKPSSAKKSRKSLFRPPVLIKQEIVSSEEEL